MQPIPSAPNGKFLPFDWSNPSVVGEIRYYASHFWPDAPIWLWADQENEEGTSTRKLLCFTVGDVLAFIDGPAGTRISIKESVEVAPELCV